MTDYFRHYYNLAHLFDDVAGRFGGNAALHCDKQTISYNNLMQWAEALAKIILDSGCTRGDVIAIAHEKHPLSYALMLAGLRTGVVYVNIDVAAPRQRNRQILTVSGARTVFYSESIHSEKMAELVSGLHCNTKLLAESELPILSPTDRENQSKLMRDLDGASIAYVMFTSGSTGVPKGVAVSHQNLLHFIAWGQDRFQISADDKFANLSPMYFDNSVFDFYIAIFSGASLVPIKREVISDPYELASLVGREECSIWFSVPSLLIYLMAMKALSAESLSCLRLIIFGGEGYPKVELKKLYDEFKIHTDLVNVYGPTECTCICSAHTLSDNDFLDLQGLPPLGHLNPNFDYRIVDENDHDCQTGELCLIGPNVASGYFGDIDRTNRAFVTLLDRQRFMKRCYRTGDIVTKENGTLYFVGRKDNQVKHLGYRIELEEIELALVGLISIRQAGVVYHRTNAAYGKIIAFVAVDGPVDKVQINEELAMVLPSYMLPNRIIIKGDLPKNANGKVDRRALLSSL